MTTTVVLGDAEPIVRTGVRRIISSCPDLELVGEAASDAELASLIEDLRPQLVITEVLCPELYGIEVIRNCCESGRPTRFLIYSSHDAGDVLEGFRAGASGYVSKHSDLPQLTKGIDAIRSGHTFIPSEVLPLIVGKPASDTGEKTCLTGREREVLKWVASGLSNKQVACRLGIATRTVEAHRSSFMRKLGLHNSSAITHYAIRAGLVDL